MISAEAEKTNLFDGQGFTHPQKPKEAGDKPASFIMKINFNPVFGFGSIPAPRVCPCRRLKPLL